MMMQDMHAARSAANMPRIAVFSRFEYDQTKISMSTNYTKAILTAGGLPVILPCTSDPRVLQSIVESFDAFLVPGGHDVDPFYYGERRNSDSGETAPERDMMELASVPLIVRADKPLLGVCRGNQVINVALGGSLFQDIHTANPDAIVHNQEPPYYKMAHEVAIEEGSLLHRSVGATRIVTNSIHHQAVNRLGDGLVVNARATDGTVEGIEMPGKRFVMGIQWHPEYLWRTDRGEMGIFQAFVDAAREGMNA